MSSKLFYALAMKIKGEAHKRAFLRIICHNVC